jgi:hypothetical protein
MYADLTEVDDFERPEVATNDSPDEKGTCRPYLASALARELGLTEECSPSESFPTPHYPGELESRSVLLTNITLGTSHADFIKAVKRFGDVDDCSFENFGLGKASVRFYDIRNAYTLRAHSVSLNGRRCIVRFGPCDRVDTYQPANNGAIAIFGIGKNVPDEKIHSVCCSFGDVREIRECPGKPTQRFVEFWDTRAAEAAKNKLDKQQIPALGRRISVDFSRPGGFRAGVHELENNRLPAILAPSSKGKLVFERKDTRAGENQNGLPRKFQAPPRSDTRIPARSDTHSAFDPAA